MNAGLIGGIAGAILGITGGLIGVWFSYRAAKGERERRFVIIGSVFCLAYVSLFVALSWLLPKARPVILIPYAVILLIGINYWNRRQSRIRQEERTG